VIFSLLKTRKKTSAALAGIAIGAGSLWGLSLWYNISWQELFSLLGGTVVFVLLIILLAISLITVIKLGSRGIANLSGNKAKAASGDNDNSADDAEP